MVQAGAAMTVTLKEQFEELPDGSVAVHVTACGGRGAVRVEPGSGARLTLIWPLLSVAVGLWVTIAPAPAEVSVAVMLFGQLIEGTSLSLTVTTKLQLWPLAVL